MDAWKTIVSYSLLLGPGFLAGGKLSKKKIRGVVLLLLMLQKSQTTWDGAAEPLVNHGINYQPQHVNSWGRLPTSTLLLTTVSNVVFSQYLQGVFRNQLYQLVGYAPVPTFLVGVFFPSHLKNIRAVVKLGEHLPQMVFHIPEYLSCNNHLVTVIFALG